MVLDFSWTDALQLQQSKSPARSFDNNIHVSEYAGNDRKVSRSGTLKAGNPAGGTYGKSGRK
jgi:hypothetical protein